VRKILVRKGVRVVSTHAVKRNVWFDARGNDYDYTYSLAITHAPKPSLVKATTATGVI
jgi:hypothetical protein